MYVARLGWEPPNQKKKKKNHQEQSKSKRNRSTRGKNKKKFLKKIVKGWYYRLSHGSFYEISLGFFLTRASELKISKKRAREKRQEEQKTAKVWNFSAQRSRTQ